MNKATGQSAIFGCLIGTAIGDALGLPCERLTRARRRKMFPSLNRPAFFFGRGMFSDDTEHSIMAVQALIVSAGEETRFADSFARQLRAWLLLLPGGAGLATLKATFKLLCGVSPSRSGVWSAGNGPAMRSAILGVCSGDDLAKLKNMVRVSTRLTHTDPKAEWGAFAVALAAHFSATSQPIDAQKYARILAQNLDDEAHEFLALVQSAIESAQIGQSAQDFAASIGCENGVSGYIFHTVPVVLQVWLRGENYREGIEEIIGCGGDADTTAAILGGIIGARVGEAGIPTQWRDSLMEWPRGISFLRKLAQRLAEVAASGKTQKPVRAFSLAILIRNIFFLAVVLLHGLRRLLPPY